MEGGAINYNDKSTNYINEYLKLLWLDTHNKTLEYEIRFGTIGRRRITRINYDNVIRQLKSVGFNFTYEQYTLKIQSEYTSTTGRWGISNIRTELSGLKLIQRFCKTNKITDEHGRVIFGVLFNQKTPYFYDVPGKSEQYNIRPKNYDEFNFRVSLQEEKNLRSTHGLVSQLINDWDTKKKIYRLVNRITGTHPNLPGIKIDMSVVRSSDKNKRGGMIPHFNITDANVFENTPTYEIEIEYDNKNTRFISKPSIASTHIRSVITNILRGLQQTNFPVRYTEIDSVLEEYMSILYPTNKPTRRIYPKDFVGPSSISLERKNIVELDSDTMTPNIRNHYTVTDKADGLRKLLMINNSGKIYLIDTNMNVQYTGASTELLSHFNSILDGEHIVYDKHGKYINLYAAFDIYYVSGESQREKTFVYKKGDETDTSKGVEDGPSTSRFTGLKHFVSSLKIKTDAGAEPIRIEHKNFYVADETDPNSIFEGCKYFIDRSKADLIEYTTDGLIFTPAYTGVGSDTIGEILPPIKKTWKASFKWKPPEYNTIDFLVSTKKMINGTSDFVGNVYKQGIDMSSTSQSNQYKTLILRVGFDEKQHGYINPCNDIITNNLPTSSSKETEFNYRPMQFYPTNPTDANAGICNIMLTKSSSVIADSTQMYIEDGTEMFEDNMIVEFKYDASKPMRWRWVPIHVRHDKTAEYRRGLRNYGNAYNVANSVWKSIHYPIDDKMITTGTDIPDDLGEDDVYYNRSGKSKTRALRNFHNLYIKRKLILGTTKRGNTLYDLAVGKAGDLPKWIAAKLKFVFGVDINLDNIINRLDGACARYLNMCKNFRTLPKALFVNANSSVNIKNGDACFSDKGKQIVNAVFGVGAKDKTTLGEGVYNQYGVAREGFNVVSCQFALHYFFHNLDTLNNFLRNVNEGCAMGGYFIGTAYDGKTLFNRLKTKKQGEGISSYIDDKKIWGITKIYDSDEFNDDTSSVGYAIDVYQESINKTLREYLVNFDYLDRLLDSYGFQLITRDEARSMNLPDATGMFEEMYNAMKQDVEREKRSRRTTKTENMIGDALLLETSPEQQRISFLNRYFVYKKVRDVNAKEIALMMSGKTELQEEMEEVETTEAVKTAKKTIKKPRKIRKLKKKIKL